ncbi:MAG: glycosyltransferase family 4 protein, partial [Patescibacteria group bacterium]
MHIIIKARNPKSEIRNFGNVFLYPTNNKFNFLYFFSAYKITSKIIRNWKLLARRSLGEVGEIRNCVITCQDPFETGLVGYFLKKKFSAQGGSLPDGGRGASGGKISLHIQIHTDFLSPYFWRESLKNKIRVLVAKKIIPSADGIRVVSERIKKSIITQLPNYQISKISILPIFVDIEKIKNAPIKTDLRKKYPGRFIILMASRLTREKNIGLAIESAKNLIPNYPNILLLIVGSGPKESKLKAESYKLHDNVVFEPWTDDLASYYKTADLFLLTSNYEGYGMTVVEATAAGLPVLMTDVGVATPTLSGREVGAPTPDVGVGSAVPVGDSKELARCLDILVGDPLERENVLENQMKILDNMPSREKY